MQGAESAKRAVEAGEQDERESAEEGIRTPEPLRDEALNLTPLPSRQPPHLSIFFL